LAAQTPLFALIEVKDSFPAVTNALDCGALDLSSDAVPHYRVVCPGTSDRASSAGRRLLGLDADEIAPPVEPTDANDWHRDKDGLKP
jgi:hypothetical protein